MAELGLAIVPLCFAALTGIKILKTKMRVLRRHGREVEAVRRKFRVQSSNFKDQLCRLLIESCEAKGQLRPGRSKVMVWGEDGDAPEWREKGKELEEVLREYLGEKHDQFLECVRGVEEAMRVMTGNLSVFAEPSEKVRWSKSTKDAFRIAFKKQDYTEQIDILKELNDEMKEMRKFVKFMNSRRNSDTDEHGETPPPAYSAATHSQPVPHPSKQSLVRHYKATRRLLAEFLDVVLNHWSCGDGSHQRHSAKVLLRSLRGGGQVATMGFLLECAGQGGLRARRTLPFQVSCRAPVQHCFGLVSPVASSASDRFPDPMGYLDARAPAAKRLRMSPPIEDDGDHDSHNENLTSESASPDQGDSFCELLAQSNTPLPLRGLAIMRQESLHFDTEHNIGSALGSRIISLTELFDLPVYDVVSDRHRIEVALMLVKGMLKAHSTPCWPRGCLMSNVRLYCGSDTDTDLASYLDTLHLSADIDAPCLDTDMDGGDSFRDTAKEAREVYGVHNMVLYTLGVALLQIGLWEEVPWKDVAQVRRKTARLSYLGVRYHRITKQLVNGTVGCGASSVVNEEVQEAVLDVICELEGLLHLA